MLAAAPGAPAAVDSLNRLSAPPAARKSHGRVALRRRGVSHEQRKAPAEGPDTARAPALTLKSDGSDTANVIDCALANPHAEPAGALAGTLAQAPISGRKAGRLSLAGVYFVYDRPDSQPAPASCPLSRQRGRS
jgi:hypothetical protein